MNDIDFLINCILDCIFIFFILYVNIDMQFFILFMIYVLVFFNLIVVVD